MSKRKCVLGVLTTEAGIKIKEEMLSWLKPIYDVFCVEQEAPGVLYEYPAIKMAADLAVDLNEPVLYIHTKGAAMPNQAQPMVRAFWQHEFTINSEKYFEMVNDCKPLVSAPYTMHKNTAWFNAFVMNPMAASKLLVYLKPQEDRYWFEQKIWNQDSSVTMLGLYDDKVASFTEPWPAFVSLFREIMSAPAKQNDKVAILTIAKNESRYIKEWLDYHRNLGVDRFYIINNDEPDENTMYNILTEEANNKHDIIQVNIPGAEELKKVGMQEGAYNAVYQQVIKKFNDIKWLAVIDIDEFLHLGGIKIHEYLDQTKFNDTDVIHLNWRLYGDNGNILYEDKPVQERFTKQCPLNVVYNDDEARKGVLENMFVKSIVRVTDKRTYLRPHHSYVENGVCRRGNGTLSDFRYAAEQLTNDECYIKHYNCKSLEEYIDRRCLPTTTDVNYQIPADAVTRLRWYFNENEKTLEKVAYVKQRLGIDV